jgi:hypothetical protein
VKQLTERDPLDRIDLSWLKPEVVEQLPPTALGQALRDAVSERARPMAVQVGSHLETNSVSTGLDETQTGPLSM